MTVFTHRPCVSLARFTYCWWRHNRFLMRSQWPDNCDAIMWTVISNSSDINFVHSDIHDQLRKTLQNPRVLCDGWLHCCSDIYKYIVLHWNSHWWICSRHIWWTRLTSQEWVRPETIRWNKGNTARRASLLFSSPMCFIQTAEWRHKGGNQLALQCAAKWTGVVTNRRTPGNLVAGSLLYASATQRCTMPYWRGHRLIVTNICDTAMPAASGDKIFVNVKMSAS